jgi:hypothetical protein
MIQRINKKLMNLFLNARRKNSSEAIENKREIKLKLRKMFFNEINRNDFKGDKHDNLNYLSKLFNSFQNFISMDNIRNRHVINHWQSYFYGVNYKGIHDTLSKLHKHENYKQLKDSILLNFDNYDSKEISFICKTCNALNLINEKDELYLKLNQYCQNNIKKLDLCDFYNILFNQFSTNLKFFRDSSNYMIDGIINNKLKHTKLDIDKNDDIFENKMEVEDAEVKLWFKLNILRSQTGLINSFKIKVTSDYLLNEAKFFN